MRRSLRLREKTPPLCPERKNKGRRKKQASPLVAGKAASPLVAGKAASPLVAGKAASPLVAGKAASPSVAGKAASPSVAGKAAEIKILQVLKEIKNLLSALVGRKKKARLSRSLRREVWRAHNGESESGKCFSCSAPISRVPGGWHCSHVRARAKGGEDTIENLRPCCPPCNIEMGVEHMFSYMERKSSRKK